MPDLNLLAATPLTAAEVDTADRVPLADVSESAPGCVTVAELAAKVLAAAAPVATSGSAADLTAGTLPDARLPAVTPLSPGLYTAVRSVAVDAAGRAVAVTADRPALPAGMAGAWRPAPATCWQDTARTTPAGVGDPVAALDDLSGNGRHLTQSTAAKRPTLGVTPQGDYYLSFNRRLSQSLAVSFTLPQPFTRVSTVRYRKAPDNNLTLDGGANDTAYLARLSTGGGSLQSYAGTSLVRALPGGYGDTDRVVQVFNGASSEIYYANALLGSAGNAGTAAAGGLSVGNQPTGSGFPTDIDFFGAAVLPAVATVGERAQMDAWAAVTAAPAAPAADLLDGDGLLLACGLSGLTLSATPPTRDATNPVLDALPYAGSAADRDKLWVGNSEDDTGSGVELHLGVGDDTADPVLRWEVATSADGRTGWTRPSLGQVRVGGSAANSYLFGQPAYYTGHAQGTDARGDTVYVACLEIWENGTGGTGNGCRVLTSPDRRAWTVARDLTANGFDGEGGDPVQMKDGRWRVYSLKGQGDSRRYIVYFDSVTADPAGDWTGPHAVPEWRSASAAVQFYKTRVRKVRGAWLALVTMYDETAGSGVMWVEPWGSADEGRTWTQLGDSTWLPRGAGGTWSDEVIIQAAMVTLASGEHLYYFTGGAEDHETYPRTSQVGIAAVPAGKLVAAAGTGTLTTPAISRPAGRRLLVTADGTGGSVTAAVLDAGGSPISGYGTADMTPITTAVTGHHVTWGGNDLPAGTWKVRLTVTAAAVNAVEVAP